MSTKGQGHLLTFVQGHIDLNNFRYLLSNTFAEWSQI